METMAKRPKILLVDDEPTNLKLLREILRKDYDLVFARNGAEMLQHATQQPDLILLDIMMPDMDGYEGCRRLQANEATRHIPVIFVTARIDMEDEVKGLEAGAVDYLTKPVQGPVVRAHVKTHIALRQARDLIARQNQEIRQQNEELQQTARLRDEVDQILRHDLKGPLNAIIGLPGTLQNDAPLDDFQKQCLQIIEESGYRLLNMINRSHDLFKMERGMYQVEAKPVDILVVLHRVMLEMRELIRSKKLSILMTLDGQTITVSHGVMVMGEELLYHCMLSNLLKNAAEASPRQESVHLDLNRQEQQTTLAMHNKGSVPLAIRDRFFEKYVTAGKVHGTGLGTYSARLMADTLGCALDLDTRREGETSLVIRFPKP